MFFCPDCHVSNRSDAKFCRKCGKSRSDLERVEVSVSVIQSTTTDVTTTISAVDVDDKSVSTDSPTAPLELDVSEGAPDLSVNIEHNESLSVPPAPPPEQTTPQCPSCWEPLRATDKFCCWCGEAQPNRVLPFMKLCLECSTFLPEKANYCYSCGTDVGYSSRKKVRAPYELFKDEDSEFFPRFDA